MTLDGMKALVREGYKRSGGIIRLAPTWVPRSFMLPGRRLKLHPDDLYAYGKERGGINERWFSSTTNADNGPLTTSDEGLSYVVFQTETGINKVLLRDVIDLIGDEVIGDEVMARFGGWNVLCKFFDNYGAIPFHLHQRDEHARLVGKVGKPEAYYFPPQLNQVKNLFPYTFFGLDPSVTKEDIRRCLEDFERGDNQITRYSRAFRLIPGTGWDVPAGILHAPGSLVTYEPQRNCDVFGMYESIVDGRAVGRELLVKDVPEERYEDIDYIVNMIDWEANVDPNFMANHYRAPKPVHDITAMEEEGYRENWVVYGSEDFSAKELTILPGRTVQIHDDAAYGFIVVQGRGMVGSHVVESPTLIRVGELTHDEYFVGIEAAHQGVKIRNESATEPLVMLKHFGPTL